MEVVTSDAEHYHVLQAFRTPVVVVPVMALEAVTFLLGSPTCAARVVVSDKSLCTNPLPVPRIGVIYVRTRDPVAIRDKTVVASHEFSNTNR